jgi:uncharacterized damage-inducible protein DinB
MTQPAWLRGPVEGIPTLLQPVAHALIDANEDVQKFIPSLSPAEIAARPAGVASVAFHLMHAMGSLDRLFTYARGEALDERQLAVLASEKTFDPAGSTGRQLAEQFAAAIGRAHAQLRSTKESELHVTRAAGRAKLPASTMGLLFHAAEHTARHVGQIVTTAKLVSGH